MRQADLASKSEVYAGGGAGAGAGGLRHGSRSTLYSLERNAGNTCTDNSDGRPTHRPSSDSRQRQHTSSRFTNPATNVSAHQRHNRPRRYTLQGAVETQASYPLYGSSHHQQHQQHHYPSTGALDRHNGAGARRRAGQRRKSDFLELHRRFSEVRQQDLPSVTVLEHNSNNKTIDPRNGRPAMEQQRPGHLSRNNSRQNGLLHPSLYPSPSNQTAGSDTSTSVGSRPTSSSGMGHRHHANGGGISTASPRGPDAPANLNLISVALLVG